MNKRRLVQQRHEPDERIEQRGVERLKRNRSTGVVSYKSLSAPQACLLDALEGLASSEPVCRKPSH
jgi:hypothetical protein